MKTLGQRLIDKTKKIREQGIKIKKLELHLKQSQDLYNVLKTDHDEVSKENEDLRNRFNTGGICYIEDANEEYVLDYVIIPPYSKWTYLQVVPSEVGSKLYMNFPFVKEQDRAFEIDTEQKLKYEGALK